MARWGSRLPLALAVLVAGVVVAAYAGQLFLGRWQNDEYRLFTVERMWGWHALPPRLAYSPRPFSELILHFYGEAVLALDRPLITTFLGLLWGAIIVAMAVAAHGALPRSPTRLLSAVALSLSTFAFVLVTDRVTEMFYWPVAAAAYLPTACGALALVFLLSTPRTRSSGLARAGTLLVVAGSSEMGAAFALSFAAGLAGELAWRKRSPTRADIWWLLPAGLSVAIFAVLFSVRVGMDELNATRFPATGHPILSFVLAMRHLVTELGGEPIGHGSAAEPLALAARVTFALGFAACFQQAGGRTPIRAYLPLAMAIAGACFFSLFAAYLHYGTDCCERQATTRSWLIDLLFVLALAPVAQALATRTGRTARIILPSVMLVAALSPGLSRIDALHHDYEARGLALESRSRTWNSGRRPDAGTMKFYLPTDGAGMLVRGTNEPLATYKVTASAPELIVAIGKFFGKSTVIVCEPWQTDKSLLLDGQFIPACPPHGGPPDIVGHFGTRR